METVIVTGAAGFIGSHVVPRLLASGYRVVGIDNFDDTYDPRFKEEHIVAYAEHPNFELARIDIRDRVALQNLFKRTTPSLIVHLAAKADTRAAVKDPYIYVDNNIVGTLHILEVAKECRIEHMVFASSSSVYGNDTHIPLREDAVADRPISPYGATKRAMELFAHAYKHNFGMSITCLRFFNAYGEHNRPNMVPYIWARALLDGKEIEMSGGGTRKRDYTYVGDTADAVISALKKPLGFEIINIGNSSPLSLTELLQVFEKVIGTKARIKERPSHRASVEETYADITKAKKLLGWKPTTSIEDGVTRLVTWMRANRLKEG